MKLISSKITLTVILQDSMITPDFRKDIEQLIGSPDNKFSLKITFDFPHFIYKFQFRTKDPEDFKRKLNQYKIQNTERIIFPEEDERPDIKSIFESFANGVFSIKNIFFPVTARIFFRVSEQIDAEHIVELVRSQIMEPSDELPRPYVLKGPDKRYRLKLKVKKPREFYEKFNRFQELNQGIDIFAVYEFPSPKTILIQYGGYVLIVAINLPRLEETFSLLLDYLK